MKRLLLPLLAAIALPTAVNANIDPKVAEICMKAPDFKGCIEGMSGGGNNLSLISEYDNALVLFESGDSSGALNAINKYLEKNANSKESYVLRAVIYSWDLENHKDAINDLNKAIEIDSAYTKAYLNAAALILDREGTMIEEMNSLGTSTADYNRYDELKIERENLYKKAIPYLEKVFELESDNLNAARTLRNIFSALDETESYNKYKVIVAELENR